MLTDQEFREDNLRWFATWNTKDMNAITSFWNEVVAPDVVYHNPGVGVLDREGFLEFMRGVFKESPDVHLNAADDILMQGDKVAVRCSLSRTDPASGKRQTCLDMYMCHYSGDKVKEVWEVTGPWQDEA